MKHSNRCVTWPIAALAFFLVGAAGAAAPTLQPVASLGGITEYRLENGLRVLLIPDPAAAMATVNIVYLVGSRHERYGETGMAHLLEHMVFKGTPSHKDIPNELSSHGASPNGTTTVDRTSYYESFAPTAENLEWALSLEADRMVNSFISKKDLDSEMTVVRNEFENGENEPMRVLNERVLSTAYLWHNYSHSPIGSRSDIEGVPIERLQAFYRTYYQPDNAVLLVGGKIDTQKTLALVQQKFGVIPKPNRVLPRLYTAEPVQDGQREITLRRAGGTPGVMLTYHIPSAGHPDIVALDMLAEVLSDPASGRLQKKLVDTRIAIGAGASVEYLHDPGTMTFSAGASEKGDVLRLRDELIKIAEGVAKEPITDTELQRVRTQFLQVYERALLDANAVTLGLTDYVAQGDWRLPFWEQDLIEKITVADVQKAAARYLVASNRTAGVFIPDDKPVRAVIPPVADLTTLLAAYGSGKTAEASVAAEEFQRTPASIEARTTRAVIGPIKLAYLPKTTRGDLVNVSLNFHFGNERALMGRAEAGGMAGSLLMAGTAQHDLAQLQDRLTEIHTEMSVNAGPTGASVSISTERKYLLEALRLAAEILQQPTFPEKEFEEARAGALSQIEGSRGDPGTLIGQVIGKLLNAQYPPGHLYYAATLDESVEQLKALKLDDLKKFHRDFYGLGRAEMAFVGSFDPAQVTPVIEKLFSKWKSAVAYERVPRRYQQVRGTTQALNTPDKEGAVFQAVSLLEIRDDDPQYAALVLGNYMLGGGFLNSRLATRIRRQDGLSYGVGSSFSADSLDKIGSFAVNAITAPQNLAKVGTAVREEIARALADGFTAEELNAAKTGYLQSWQLGLADDGSIASALIGQMFRGRDFHWDEQYEAQVRALTPQSVTQAMRRFIDASRFVTVTAGDSSKTGK